MGTLTYRPGKADEQKWDWDPSDPDFDIAYAVESATDWPWQLFLSKYGVGSHTAMQALVYAFLKRDNDRLKLASVQVKYSELEYESDDADVPVEDIEDDEPKAKGKKKAGDQGEA